MLGLGNSADFQPELEAFRNPVPHGPIIVHSRRRPGAAVVDIIIRDYSLPESGAGDEPRCPFILGFSAIGEPTSRPKLRAGS